MHTKVAGLLTHPFTGVSPSHRTIGESDFVTPPAALVLERSGLTAAGPVQDFHLVPFSAAHIKRRRQPPPGAVIWAQSYRFAT